MDEYYVKDVAKNKNIVGTMKMFTGIAYHHYLKNWEVRPVLGIGLKQMAATSISYVLKKKDSNEAYSVKYEWMDNENEVENIGYLSGELNIIYYPKNRKFGWLFGVTCRHYLSGVEFWKEFRDFYTQELIDRWNIKGQKNNMLGIKIGTTF
jgi:hypothetical protein